MLFIAHQFLIHGFCAVANGSGRAAWEQRLHWLDPRIGLLTLGKELQGKLFPKCNPFDKTLHVLLFT